jgi:hypothetical protein
MEDDVTLDEFETLAKATSLRNAKQMITEFGPLIAHMFAARQTPEFSAKFYALMDAIANCTASQLGSISLSMFDNYEDARGFASDISEHSKLRTLLLVNKKSQGLIDEELIAEFDKATGKPVQSPNFDFRDHIAPTTPDSGRASEIGGAE